MVLGRLLNLSVLTYFFICKMMIMTELIYKRTLTRIIIFVIIILQGSDEPSQKVRRNLH